VLYGRGFAALQRLHEQFSDAHAARAGRTRVLCLRIGGGCLCRRSGVVPYRQWQSRFQLAEQWVRLQWVRSALPRRVCTARRLHDRGGHDRHIAAHHSGSHRPARPAWAGTYSHWPRSHLDSSHQHSGHGDLSEPGTEYGTGARERRLGSGATLVVLGRTTHRCSSRWGSLSMAGWQGVRHSRVDLR
jgi:hypothetical protein